MFNLKKMIIVIVSICVVGCIATPSIPVSTYSGTTSLVNFPTPQIESKADIGQTIISTANITKIEAINVPNISEEASGTNAILNGGILPLYLGHC